MKQARLILIAVSPRIGRLDTKSTIRTPQPTRMRKRSERGSSSGQRRATPRFRWCKKTFKSGSASYGAEESGSTAASWNSQLNKISLFARIMYVSSDALWTGRWKQGRPVGFGNKAVKFQRGRESRWAKS